MTEKNEQSKRGKNQVKSINKKGLKWNKVHEWRLWVKKNKTFFKKKERKTVNELDGEGHSAQLCFDKKAKNEWLINDSTLFY